MSLHIQIERFEGPLGLLLHLIRKEEMDIFDINILQITKQYLDYIKAMKQLDLELAGEFVAMAATLIHIKSRMLLPSYTEEGEEVENADPRKELVQKLLEYQKFQEVSAQLYERPLMGRDVFVRGRRESVEVVDDGEVIIEEDNALFALIACYRKVVKSMKKSVHRVGTELQSIASRILEIREALTVGFRMRFGELISKSGSSRDQVLVTFLSLLELAKMGFVSLFQADSYSEIHIEAKKDIEGDVVSQVEDYEGVNKTALTDDLPLFEGAMDFEDESGEEVVSDSQESLVDAATDEEIFAEEQRLDLDSKEELNLSVEVTEPTHGLGAGFGEPEPSLS